MGSKTLLPQNPSVVNWGCQLTQIGLYNGRRIALIMLEVFCLFNVAVLSLSSALWGFVSTKL